MLFYPCADWIEADRPPRAKTWCCSYRDANGELKREKLSTDKSAALLMLADRKKRVELERAGHVDPFEQHRKTLLLCPKCDSKGTVRDNRGDRQPCDQCPDEPTGKEKPKPQPHLGAYRRHLEAKGDSPDHIEQTIHYAALVLNACGFQRTADLAAGPVVHWLQTKREAGRSHRTVMRH